MTKPHNCIRQAASPTSAQTTTCPAVSAAQHLGVLWAALDGAEFERRHATDIQRRDAETRYDDINASKEAAERMLSCVQASSFVGAFAQLCLARDVADDIAGAIDPEQVEELAPIVRKFERLIVSALTALRSALSPAEFASVREMVDPYWQPGQRGAFRWIDDLPALAERGRLETAGGRELKTVAATA